MTPTCDGDRWSEWSERAAIIEYEGGHPRDWAEALAWLLVMAPPKDVWPDRWRSIALRAASMVERLAAVAAMKGWTPARVLGVTTFGDQLRPDALVWRLDRARAREVLESGAIEFEGAGVRFSLRPRGS